MPTVDLTPQALENINKLMSENGMNGFGLRVAIKGGGCSGYSHILEFQEQPEEGDEVYEVNGVKMFVGNFKREFLEGTVVDFIDTLVESGFKLTNPNAKRSCGCGSSFDLDDKPAAHA